VVAATPDPSLKLTRYGSHRQAAPDHGGRRPSAASRRLPQRAAQLERQPPGAAMKDGLGSIRTDLQGQGAGVVAAAGERGNRRGCAGISERTKPTDSLG